ncbi:MAG: amidohydrolase family protein [Christensenellales bacterium]|jgi:predicted TIM-barrel fold metal-dependent hydrolase
MEYFSKSDALTEHKYYPVIDAHIHIRTLARALNQNAVLRDSGLRGMCMQCLPRLSDEFLANNLDSMLLKFLLQGEIYSFGGFYRPEEGEDPKKQDYLMQARHLIAMGCDGIKMYDAKPSVRKVLDMPLDCEEFDPMYSYLDDNDIPMMNHVGDPKNFWDGDDAPELAKQYGWTYDSTYVHPEQYFTEIENVFKKHPCLKMVLAHFFFLSVDLPRLEKFLDTYENAYIDITPGTEMYIDFTAEPECWNSFFTKFQDRIIFGTDNGFFGEICYEINAVRTFLETTNEFDAWDMRIHGIGLNEEALRKIYYGNFKKLVSDPKLPNLPLVVEEYYTTLRKAQKSELRGNLLRDLEDAKTILEKLGVEV